MHISTNEKKAAKGMVLANAKNLHNGPAFQDVYLKPDLTREQRKRDAELRRENAKSKGKKLEDSEGENRRCQTAPLMH